MSNQKAKPKTRKDMEDLLGVLLGGAKNLTDAIGFMDELGENDYLGKGERVFATMPLLASYCSRARTHFQGIVEARRAIGREVAAKQLGKKT